MSSACIRGYTACDTFTESPEVISAIARSARASVVSSSKEWRSSV